MDDILDHDIHFIEVEIIHKGVKFIIMIMKTLEFLNDQTNFEFKDMVFHLLKMILSWLLISSNYLIKLFNCILHLSCIYNHLNGFSSIIKDIK